MEPRASATLYQAIFQRHAVSSNLEEERSLVQDFDSITPFRRLLGLIYYLPYEWRKFLLDACRIQTRPYDNLELSKRLNSLKVREVPIPFKLSGTRPHRRGYFAESKKKGKKKNKIPTSRDEARRAQRFATSSVTIEEVVGLYVNIFDNWLLNCVLSLFVRSERTIFIDEFLAVNEELIKKEMGAAFIATGHYTSQLDYSAVFLEDAFHDVHPDRSGSTQAVRQTIQAGLRQLRQRGSDMERCMFLFPAYSTQKNVSFATQRNLALSLGVDTLVDHPYTTGDLLRHYFQTGERIPGPLEVRTAWKQHDLKGRVYYCMGGDAYWSGLFIKEVVNDLLKILPCTHPFSRFEIKRINPLRDDEILITYDYSAFTTSLTELKYMLWYLGTSLEGTSVMCLDVRQGIICMDLGTMILDYNEAMNMHQEFSVERLITSDSWEDPIMYQGRSGSLGVQGNIGFSTLNHGIGLSSLTGTPDQDSCVGDDALAKLHISILATAFVAINRLGAVHPEKIAVLRKPNTAKELYAQQFKYLKRPLNVDHEGFPSAGALDSFPNLMSVLFPEGDEYHTEVDRDIGTCVRTFCMQWGRFLSRCQKTPDALDFNLEDDLAIVIQSIQAAYRKYDLPLSGCLPGHGTYRVYNPKTDYSQDKGEVTRWQITFVVPPCDNLEIFQEDWLRVLLSRDSDKSVLWPVTAELVPPEQIYVDMVFHANADKILSLMEVLGCVEKEMMIQNLPLTVSLQEEIYKQIVGGVAAPAVYEYRVLQVPDWYTEAFERIYHFVEPDLVTDYAARTIISTLYDSDQ